MPHHYNCCIPGCTNSFRNAPYLHYYRIPKDEKQRKIYDHLLRNKTLNLQSECTRICSAHFEGGEKLSRNHLPSIFPWTKEAPKRREIKRQPLEELVNTQKKTKRQTTTNNDIDQEPVQQDPVPEQEHIQANKLNSTCEQATQTSLSALDIDELERLKIQLLACQEENENLKSDNQRFKNEVGRLKHDFANHVRFDIDKYKNCDEDITFYTGFPDYNAMMLCYTIVEKSAKNISYDTERIYSDKQLGRPRILTCFQEFTLVMMRLRLGLFEKDLAHRFNISLTSVSRILRTWLRFLRMEFEPLINIPPTEVIKLHMPEVFKRLYPNLTIIVDCTEVEMEKPSSLNAQSTCYSSYKSKNTMKSLIGISPSGVISFVSELFPGSSSDKEIVVQSDFLTKLKPGDQVMADKGFNCQDELASVGATLVLPHMLKGIKQFSKQQTEHNKKVASLRIHVERVMERIKNWHIFDHRIPISLAPLASDMLIVVCALSNFHPPLIN